MLIPLLIIVNKLYDEGKVPELWRYVYVIPVYKKGFKTPAINHRPVLVTCVICKLMEKIEILFDDGVITNEMAY